jgi:hypothetical protein
MRWLNEPTQVGGESPGHKSSKPVENCRGKLIASATPPLPE